MSIRPELLAQANNSRADDLDPNQRKSITKSPRRSFRGFINLIGVVNEDQLEKKEKEEALKKADASKIDHRDIKRLKRKLEKQLKGLKKNELEPMVKKSIARFKSQNVPKQLGLPHYEKDRWALIVKMLSRPISTSAQLQEIWRTCPIPMDRNEGEGFAKFLDNDATEQEKATFYKRALPFMQKLVLSLPNLFGPEKNPCDLLFMKQRGDVTCNALQVAAMVACGFFCILNMEYRGFYEHGLPIDSASQFHNANMRVLLEITRRASHCKYRCLINYFATVSMEKNAIRRLVTLHKHVVDGATLGKKICLGALQTSSRKLVNVNFNKGTLRDDPDPGVLSVVFASDHPGGHFIGEGNDVEELFLCEYPESYLLLLFLEKLAPNEVAMIIGAQHHNRVKVINQGFGLQYCGAAKPVTVTCQQNPNRLATFFLMLTPQDVNYVDQYKPYIMQRELARVYAGYSIPQQVFQHKITKIKTGNWGVGPCGGDLELKFALQWIGLSITCPDSTIEYWAEEEPAARNLPALIELNSKMRLTVAQGWHLILLLSVEDPKKRCSLVRFAEKLSEILRMQAMQAQQRAKEKAKAKQSQPVDRDSSHRSSRRGSSRRSSRGLKGIPES